MIRGILSLTSLLFFYMIKQLLTFKIKYSQSQKERIISKVNDMGISVRSIQIMTVQTKLDGSLLACVFY